MDKKHKIKEIIERLKSNEDINNINSETKEFLKNMTPSELGMIEQEIINEGITRKNMRKLCLVHLEVMKDNLSNKNIKLDRDHPIFIMKEEHLEILKSVNKLKKIKERIDRSDDYSDIEIELLFLNSIARNLLGADKHHQREEEALFPIMEKNGITEPPEIMKEEHIEIKDKKKELYNLSCEYKDIEFNEFKDRIKNISEFIINELTSHIYKEDNILYPMAIETLTKEQWDKIKIQCDSIGYCCFTPKNDDVE